MIRNTTRRWTRVIAGSPRSWKVVRILIVTLAAVIVCSWFAFPKLRERGLIRYGWKEAHPFYRAEPSWEAPPIRDPFPLLAETDAAPPPIPSYNRPAPDAWRAYPNVTAAPPLIIGFTRSWPLLLQAVVSYITAGWPPQDIYVVENTGVQESNARQLLTLQHPFYLNHTTLRRLGVNIVQTPTLLSFAQLQNFYHHMTYTRDWPYFFWSHMDVLALSFEGGYDDVTPAADQPGYKSLYTLCLEALSDTISSGGKWASQFFAYDHLALMNPLAIEDVGGWDTLIPYYTTDCDIYTRFIMRGWEQGNKPAGIITDVAITLEDLSALYRVRGVEPEVMDINPWEHHHPQSSKDKRKRSTSTTIEETIYDKFLSSSSAEEPNNNNSPSDLMANWEKLRVTADGMFHNKNGGGARRRNRWQLAQHGGEGEPYHVDAAGFHKGLDYMIDSGRKIFGMKWGHEDCDLIGGGKLKWDDQWKVQKDFSGWWF